MGIKKPVYPDMDIREVNNVFTIKSYLRLKNQNDGKYYLTLHKQECQVVGLTDSSVESCIKDTFVRFNDGIYRMILYGMVDVSLYFVDNDPVWEIDSDQTDEDKRLYALTL